MTIVMPIVVTIGVLLMLRAGERRVAAASSADTRVNRAGIGRTFQRRVADCCPVIGVALIGVALMVPTAWRLIT